MATSTTGRWADPSYPSAATAPRCPVLDVATNCGNLGPSGGGDSVEPDEYVVFVAEDIVMCEQVRIIYLDAVAAIARRAEFEAIQGGEPYPYLD